MANNDRRKSNEFIVYDDHVVIVDNNKRKFIVDHEGYARILEFDRYWYVNGRKNGKEPYVSTKYNGTTIQLHNFLMKPERGFIVDHINGDKTDNKYLNLRIVTEQQNAMNKTIQKNNTSCVKGVNHVKRNNKWVAKIQYMGKRIVLGTYDTIEEATEARRVAEEKYFGEFNREIKR